MGPDLPMGFSMALAQNEAAMKQFESLSEAEKQAVIQRTHSVTSKQEMRRLVASLCDQGGARALCLRAAYIVFQSGGYPLAVHADLISCHDLWTIGFPRWSLWAPDRTQPNHSSSKARTSGVRGQFRKPRFCRTTNFLSSSSRV